MSADRTPARARLEAWRACGADRVNVVGFHRLDALERRAASHGGESRRLLDARLSQLLDAYAAALERSGFQLAADAADDATGDAGVDGAVSADPPRSALGGLLDHFDQARSHADAAAADAAPRPAFPQLAALDEFKQLWSKLRVQSQLRESLEQAPTDAGPLNSGALVHRSLSLMRELSPEYAQQFLSYVDALAWIERMSEGGVVELEDTLRTGGSGKRGRDRPRKRAD